MRAVSPVWTYGHINPVAVGVQHLSVTISVSLSISLCHSDTLILCLSDTLSLFMILACSLEVIFNGIQGLNIYSHADSLILSLSLLCEIKELKTSRFTLMLILSMILSLTLHQFLSPSFSL